MELSPEQKAALEQQKAQCPFCRIIKGELPTRKVYEDSVLVAVLDINPATKGHILVMPKEHYPILPLIPAEEFDHLCRHIKYLSRSLRDSLLAPGTTVYIANGAAAGQQSSHFMIHIIPRESPEELPIFELPVKEVSAEETEKLFALLKNNLPLMLRSRYQMYPLEGQAPSIASKDQLAQVIESNEKLREIIINNPDEFKAMIPSNPQLQALFQGIDIDKLSQKLKGVYKKQKEQATDLDKVSRLFGA